MVGECTEIIASALLLLFFNSDFKRRIKKFEQREAGAELDKKLWVGALSF